MENKKSKAKKIKNPGTGLTGGASRARDAMGRALVAECHVAKGLDCAMALLEVKSFFCRMNLIKLFVASVRRVYPVRIRIFAFMSYLAPRPIRVEGWISRPIYPTRSITAGETSGVEMARTLLYDVLHWLHYDYG